MSRRNNIVNLSPASEEKISRALCIIKDTEQCIRSITFQDNVGVLNYGRSRTSILLPPINVSFQLISTTDLDNLTLEIENLKVN